MAIFSQKVSNFLSSYTKRKNILVKFCIDDFQIKSLKHLNNFQITGLVLAINKVIVDADTNKKVSLEEILSSTQKPR